MLCNRLPIEHCVIFFVFIDFEENYPMKLNLPAGWLYLLINCYMKKIKSKDVLQVFLYFNAPFAIPRLCSRNKHVLSKSHGIRPPPGYLNIYVGLTVKPTAVVVNHINKCRDHVGHQPSVMQSRRSYGSAWQWISKQKKELHFLQLLRRQRGNAGFSAL